MKVQSNKPESQSQIAAHSDTSLTMQSDESSDFFSVMIANLLSVPVLSSQSESVTDTAMQAELQNDDVNKEQLLNAKTASSQLMSELIVNLLNASMQQAGTESAPVTPDINVNAQSNQTPSQAEKNASVTQKLLDSFPQFSKEADIERISRLNNKDMDAVQREILFKQDNQLQTDWSENSNRQTQSAASTSSVNNMHALPAELLQEVAASLMKNDKQNKVYGYQDLKNQKNSYETALQQLNNQNNISNYQSVVNNNDVVTRQANVNEEQLMTVYQSRNGKSDYPSETQNNYIDALIEMSGIINNKTSNLMNEQPVPNVKSDGQTDYANTARSINQPEYELKIELQSQAFDLSGKEVYHANIKIHPPELGAVIAKLKIDKNNAELIIVAENNQVKSIVEANLSQLKESFQKHDINITSVQIDVQNPQSGMSDQSSKEQRAQDSSENKDQAADTRKSETAKKEAKQKLNSLIDTYA